MNERNDQHENQDEHASSHNSQGTEGVEGASSDDAASAPSFLIVGRVAGVFGLRGEIKVEIFTDFPARFAALQRVFLSQRPVPVESSRLHRGMAILKLKGVDSVEAAEKLVGQMVEVSREEAVPLPAGHYYHYQIIGLQVFTTSGEPIGEVVDILPTGANDVYVVRTSGRERLIPAIRDVVKQIDLDRRRLIIEPMAGLLD